MSYNRNKKKNEKEPFPPPTCKRSLKRRSGCNFSLFAALGCYSLLHQVTPCVAFQSVHGNHLNYRHRSLRNQRHPCRRELRYNTHKITAVDSRLWISSTKGHHDEGNIQVSTNGSVPQNQLGPQLSPLSLTLQELSKEVGGSGRASAIWDCIRLGIDPNLFYSPEENSLDQCDESIRSGEAANEMNYDHSDLMGEMDDSDKLLLETWQSASSYVRNTAPSTHQDAANVYTKSLKYPSRKNGQGLGLEAWSKLQNIMKRYHQSNNPLLLNLSNDHTKSNSVASNSSHYTFQNSIASISQINISQDGTTKLLLKMVKDGLEVECVIIPWLDKGFSTLCVSSQVGCMQGCTFCATGRMGKLRSLTPDEILVQIYYATKMCRLTQSIQHPQNLEHAHLPPIDNIVFMGMGEPADNAPSVLRAVNTLADRRMFGLAQSKITISTVAPNPTSFQILGEAPAALAWSVHAVDDKLRKELVPTTKYSMEELRNGLCEALSLRSNRLRRTMLEVVLIDGVNDSNDDADRLAKFAQSIIRDVAGAKVVLNLIPFNDIGHPTYCAPSSERVLQFQKRVLECGSGSLSNGKNNGVVCYVRTTRGDEESAACGQLATKKKKSLSN